MIDSSKWEIIEGIESAAQGKSIVNSISERRWRELYSSSKISKTVRRSDYNGILTKQVKRIIMKDASKIPASVPWIY
jgi:cobalamin-dependent methionine synthase I